MPRFAAFVLATIALNAMGQQPGFDDYSSMLKQLGITKIRRGPDPNNQGTFDEATANRYADSMPDVLRLQDGTRVTRADQWPKRRAEILELFNREVYGRVPRRVPRVTWEVVGVVPSESGGVPIVTKNLVGHVDNRSYPLVTVDIKASFTVPVHTKGPVPIIIEFGGFNFRRPNTVPWTDQAIAHGWGYGSITPNSIQPDNAKLNTGIIGLCNKGQPRKPDDWGALRAWGWGLSKLIDYFEKAKDCNVDPKKVGIEGVSRYGKAALVAEAFDARVAVAFVGSSGEGGAKLHRHIFGEAVENLAGGEFYWMAGNFIKYGADDPHKTAADLPVDSHELIALCAPRPCFISYGVTQHGDPNWVDAHGSFMAGVLASPVYELLGKKGFGTPGNYLTDPMPPIGQLIGGELAWRQHDGGHEVTPNWPPFFDWVARYIQSPGVVPSGEPYRVRADEPAPRADQNSQKAHADLLKKKGAGQIDVYFEGDSITRRWGCADPTWAPMLDNWKDNFYGWNAADFGWGGDTTQNIIWRLLNGELEGVNPKVIVLLAGTNNIGPGPGNSRLVSEVTRGLKRIIEICRSKAPSATLVVTGIFPRKGNPGVMETISAINRNLQAMSGPSVRYLDVSKSFLNADGSLKEGMTVDGLHPSVAGYQAWADGLKPILRELLGPPATTDHAPPPTADPSAITRFSVN